MKPILLAAALVCFTAPAFAAGDRKHANHQKQAAAAEEPSLASPDPRQRRAPAAKMGGMLNTDVTPAQAKRVAEQTNREILRKKKRGNPR